MKKRVKIAKNENEYWIAADFDTVFRQKYPGLEGDMYDCDNEEKKTITDEVNFILKNNWNVTKHICEYIWVFSKFNNLQESTEFYEIIKKVRSLKPADEQQYIELEEGAVSLFIELSDRFMKIINNEEFEDDSLKSKLDEKGKRKKLMGPVEFEKFNEVFTEFKMAETVRD